MKRGILHMQHGLRDRIWEEVQAEVAACHGVREICDEVAARIAYEWDRGYGYCQPFTDVWFRHQVEVADLINAIGDWYPQAIRYGGVEELDLLGTWAVNHPSLEPKTYALSISAGFPGRDLPPDGSEPQFNSIATAREYFRSWVVESGNDYLRTDGCGPAGWLHFASAWDGISYGDGYRCIFELGPRLGIRTMHA